MGTKILAVDCARVAELIERYDDLPLGRIFPGQTMFFGIDRR